MNAQRGCYLFPNVLDNANEGSQGCNNEEFSLYSQAGIIPCHGQGC